MCELLGFYREAEEENAQNHFVASGHHDRSAGGSKFHRLNVGLRKLTPARYQFSLDSVEAKRLSADVSARNYFPMEIEFITDVGFKLTHNGRSLILEASSIGKIGAILSDREIIAMASAISNYTSAISGRNPLPFSKSAVTPDVAPSLKEDVAYKFTDDDGLAFWMKGSILLNPPAKYLRIENPHARDLLEGRGLVYLQGASRFATISSLSGFNSLIICTSVDARKSERAVRTTKFGTRIVKINQATKFAQQISKLACAANFVVRDVTYSDAKAVKGTSNFGDSFADEFGTGDLTDAALQYIAEHWMDELIHKTTAASIFTKPLSFRPERERRFQFVFERNVAEPMVVEDPALADFLEIIQ